MGGVVTGMAGIDAGGDVFIASGQEKQTKVQEWIQWKQWALNHKDFEAYKEEKIGKIKTFNKNIEIKLKDPEFQKELEPLIKEFNDQTISNRKKESEANKTFGIISLSVIVFFVVSFGLSSLQERNNNPSEIKIPPVDKSWVNKPKKTVFADEETLRWCMKAEPTELKGYWVRYYKFYCID